MTVSSSAAEIRFRVFRAAVPTCSAFSSTSDVFASDAFFATVRDRVVLVFGAAGTGADFVAHLARLGGIAARNRCRECRRLRWAPS